MSAQLVLKKKLSLVVPDTLLRLMKESLWRDAKLKFKEMFGCDRIYLRSYINEFMWRHNNKLNEKNAFDSIMLALANYFSKENNLEFRGHRSDCK